MRTRPHRSYLNRHAKTVTGKVPRSVPAIRVVVEVLRRGAKTWSMGNGFATNSPEKLQNYVMGIFRRSKGNIECVRVVDYHSGTILSGWYKGRKML